MELSKLQLEFETQRGKTFQIFLLHSNALKYIIKDTSLQLLMVSQFSQYFALVFSCLTGFMKHCGPSVSCIKYQLLLFQFLIISLLCQAFKTV